MDRYRLARLHLKSIGGDPREWCEDHGVSVRRTRGICWLAGLVLLALALHLAGVKLAGLTQSARAATSGRHTARSAAHAGYALGTLTLTFVDRHRAIRLRGGRSAPRTLLTYISYPAQGARGSAAAPAPGPFPLVVFAHGFDVTPATYTRLLESWTRAGYVVAAPLFPLTNPHALGGPDEADVVNQPGDLSFVISSLLAANKVPGALAGLIDPQHIAVAGHSDGAETALASAYSRRKHDARISAALVFSGAEMSGIGGYDFAAQRPALLAVQGTNDVFNEARYTYAYFAAAPRPKYLLRLLGAGHLPPYTTEQPQLAIIERVTRAFLDGYLKGSASSLALLAPLGNLAGTTSLLSDR